VPPDVAAPERPQSGLTFAQLAVGLSFLTIAVLACLGPAQADTFWALRAGEDIWRTGRVSLVDAYSHTAAGRPWPDHEWLWQTGLFLSHRLGGFPLATLGAAAFITGAHALAYRMMHGGPRLRGAILVAGAVVGANAWALRPQVASLFLLVLLLWLLVREREALIPPLFALWANLHGGVVLGGVLLAAITAAAWVWNRRRFRRLLVVTILSGGATALTPLGTGLWTFVLGWAKAAGKTGVSEWRFTAPVDAEGILFWLLALGFCALTVRTWRRRDPADAPPSSAASSSTSWPDRLLVIAALVALPFAVSSIRNVASFVLIAMPAATRLIAAAWPRLAAPPAPSRSESPRLNLGILVVATLAAIASVGVAWSRPLPMLGWRPMSAGARTAIAACPDPLYNGYNQGGYLIWSVKGKPVFIDGRHDCYSPEFLIEDRLVETGEADFQPLFEHHEIRCAALAADSSLAVRLEAAGWRRSFADAQWIVLLSPLGEVEHL
jgi:hypothetical protein